MEGSIDVSDECSLPDFFSKGELMKHDEENNSDDGTPTTMSSESLENIRTSPAADISTLVDERNPRNLTGASQDNDCFEILSVSNHGLKEKAPQSPGVLKKKLNMRSLLSPEYNRSNSTGSTSRSSLFHPREPQNLEAFHSSLRSLNFSPTALDVDSFTLEPTTCKSALASDSDDDMSEDGLEDIVPLKGEEVPSKGDNTSLGAMLNKAPSKNQASGENVMKRAKSSESLISMESWFSTPFDIEPKKKAPAARYNNLGASLGNIMEDQASPNGMRRIASTGKLSTEFPSPFKAFGEDDEMSGSLGSFGKQNTIPEFPSFQESFREALTIDPFEDDAASFSQRNDEDDDVSDIQSPILPVQPKIRKLDGSRVENKEATERRLMLEAHFEEIKQKKNRNSAVMKKELAERDKLIASLEQQLQDMNSDSKSHSSSRLDDDNSKSKNSSGNKTKRKSKSSGKNSKKKKDKKKKIHKHFERNQISASIGMCGEIKVEESPLVKKRSLPSGRFDKKGLGLPDMGLDDLVDDTDSAAKRSKPKRRSSSGHFRDRERPKRSADPKRSNSLGTLKSKKEKLQGSKVESKKRVSEKAMISAVSAHGLPSSDDLGAMPLDHAESFHSPLRNSGKSSKKKSSKDSKAKRRNSLRNLGKLVRHSNRHIQDEQDDVSWAKVVSTVEEKPETGSESKKDGAASPKSSGRKPKNKDLLKRFGKRKSVV